MPIVTDPKYDISLLPGGPIVQGEPVKAEEDPGLMDVLTAISVEHTVAGAAIQKYVNYPSPGLEYTEPGWDAADHIQGYEDYADMLVDAPNSAELRTRKVRIDESRKHRDVIARYGIGGTAWDVAFSLLDPTFLVAAGIAPELSAAKAQQMTRLAKSVYAAKQGAVSGATYEAAMQALQDQRSAPESLATIGASTLLGGVLGSMYRTSKDPAIKEALKEMDASIPQSTVGAQQVRKETTLARESLVGASKKLSDMMSKIPLIGTDYSKVNASLFTVDKQIMQDLSDLTGILGKNLEGDANPASLSALQARHEARVANYADVENMAWHEYKQRVPKPQQMNKDSFVESVARASRRDDSVGIPEVDKAAKYLRDEVFDPLKNDAIQYGLLKDPEKAALDRIKKAAVGKYVKAEEGQIYSDYSAKARSKILSKRDFSNQTKLLISEPSDAFIPEMDSAASSIRDFFLQSAIKEQAGGRGLAGITRRAKINAILDDAYSAYSKRLEPESIGKFRARAANDLDVNEDVARLRQLLKDAESGEAAKRVHLRGLESGEGKMRVVGAKSYFKRMYDQAKIRDNLSAWNKVLFTHFRRTSDASDEEIYAAVEDVTKKIMHQDVGRTNFNTVIDVAKAGPLKERTLDIPDELIEPFLVNDPVKVARAYVRELGPQVELAKRFHGDVTLEGELSRLSDEVSALKQKVEKSDLPDKVKSEKLKEISKQATDSMDAIVRMRDRFLNKTGALSPSASKSERAAVRAARGWRNLVMSAKGGGIPIVGGIMDATKIIIHNGFLPTMTKAVQLAASKEFRQLSRAKARRAGSAVEVALSRRANVQYEGAITEGWTQKLVEGLFKYTGMNHIMDFNQMLSATLFEDRVIKAAKNIDGLSKYELAELASLGLGKKELKAIAKQVEKHGGEVDGVGISGSALWNDEDIPELGKIYDAAVLKETRHAVQQPGVADRVWWMDSEIGKVVGQLKTFALSAPVRMALQPVQMASMGQYGRAARYVGFMMLGGYLTASLRGLIAGVKPETDPKKAVSSAITETGLLGVIPDVLGPAGRRVAPGWFGKGKYSDRDIFSAVGGPAIGQGVDAWDILFNRTADNRVSANDAHAIRRMLPWQNAWMFRRAINGLEGEISEALDLKGATNQTFFERVVETK